MRLIVADLTARALCGQVLRELHSHLLDAEFPLQVRSCWSLLQQQDSSEQHLILPTSCPEYAFHTTPPHPTSTSLHPHQSPSDLTSPPPRLLSLRLDDVLLGGLHTGEVTEVVGSSSSGKTQLCLLAATVTTACSPASVLYLDTSQSFSVDRVAEIHRGLVQRAPHGTVLPLLPTLDRLHHTSVHSLHSLLALLSTLSTSLASPSTTPFTSTLRLLIIDSLASLISPILGGRHHRGHALLAHTAHALHSLATQQHLAILITNHTVSARGGGGGGGGGGGVVGALGESWTYVADTRVGMEVVKGSGLGIGVGEGGGGEEVASAKTVRKVVRVSLTKSSNGQPGRSCFCDITARGLTANLTP